MGSIAHECEHGGMHIMEDNLIVEIDNGDSATQGGEIIVTDLYNYATPLIRYRLGDFAAISNQFCACGRTLKLLSGIHGRAYDCILTEEGKLFHPEMVMYIFEDIKDSRSGIAQFQVIQETPTHLHVKIVKAQNYDQSTESYISEEFKKRMSPSLLTTFEYVDTITRENSGKLRLVISNVNRQG